MVLALGAPAFVGFAGVTGPALRYRDVNVAVLAEGDSVAIVKVTEENKITTASVIGGIAGLLIGGVWVGGALFTISSYLARKKDDDVAAALKGVAAGSMEALNFVGYLNDKYTVTDKIGSALDDALKNSGDVASAVKTAGDAVKAFDKDVGIKDSLGGILAASSDLLSQALDKAVELDKEYKVIDQVKAKIDELTKAK